MVDEQNAPIHLQENGWTQDAGRYRYQWTHPTLASGGFHRLEEAIEIQNEFFEKQRLARLQEVMETTRSMSQTQIPLDQIPSATLSIVGPEPQLVAIRFPASEKKNISHLIDLFQQMREAQPHLPKMLVYFGDEPLDIAQLDEQAMKEAGWVRNYVPPGLVTIKASGEPSDELLARLRAQLTDDNKAGFWRMLYLASPRVTRSAAFDVLELIGAERERQIEAENYSFGHDDAHFCGELACAAACYATPPMQRGDNEIEAQLWPKGWDVKDCGDDRERELVIAGALIVAELERLRRKRGQAQGESFDVLRDRANVAATAEVLNYDGPGFVDGYVDEKGDFEVTNDMLVERRERALRGEN